MRIEYIFLFESADLVARANSSHILQFPTTVVDTRSPKTVSRSEDSPSDFFCRRDLFRRLIGSHLTQCFLAPGHQSADLVALG
ncbi:hypothetical protein LSTR_LSTR009614 [Laodelphax striatellus]|uniref:Uncharacterized protein n=1 Tax=Laodelphax striatellus TaxID=195883 RepID=A0A482WIV2_LAOST|nr:hypothetical protein LSTR_LSTR009614 [Laodelphax striatellus]